MVGKKKATGLSKRQSFLDPAIIAENRDIMRFNQRAEAEATGVASPGRAGNRGPGGRPDSAGGPRRGPGGAPPRRPPRPDAATPEQAAALRNAVLEAVGETGLEEAAGRLAEQLARHGRFDRASDAGWTLAVGGHPEARTEEQWQLLRAAWSKIRLRALEVWAETHPDAAELLERERKEARRRPARPASARRPRRGPRPGRGPGRSGADATPVASDDPAGEASRAEAASAPGPTGRDDAPEAPSQAAPDAPVEQAPVSELQPAGAALADPAEPAAETGLEPAGEPSAEPAGTGEPATVASDATPPPPDPGDAGPEDAARSAYNSDDVL